MADFGESSSVPLNSADEKPVVVRVKRKAFQSRVDALWLEINERPSKRPSLDFEKLSISDSSGIELSEVLKTKKVLVRHVETVSSSETVFDISQLFAPVPSVGFERTCKIEERRHVFKKESHKQDKLLARAREEQEALAKSARYEQIWRSRKGSKVPVLDKELHEACRLYDVVRVDAEETSNEAQHNSQVRENTSLEDHEIMRGYLPLLREFIPDAAEEIESDIYAYLSGRESKEDYVYDLYTVKEDTDITDEEALHPFPLVQVDDEDEFYDGLDDSDYETDDSNAEDNPRNEYPDEISEDGEDESEASDDESEEEDESENGSDKCSNPDDSVSNSSGEPDLLEEDEACEFDDGGDLYEEVDDDGDGDGEDWRWSYR